MGNMSEYRGLIVIVTFVAITLLLIGMAVSESPTMFVDENTQGSSPLSGEGVAGPSTFLAWNSSVVAQLNDTYPELDVSIGGWDFTFFNRDDGGTVHFLQVETYFTFYGMFRYSEEDMEWYNTSTNRKVSIQHDVYTDPPRIYRHSHQVMDMNDIDIAYGTGNITDLTYKIRNTKTGLTISIAFDVDAYATPSEALAGDGLTICLQQDFSDRNTSINIVSFISGLFLFSIPGVDPYVCAIISFALDSALAYITFIFVLRIIGAVFGGGGA